MQSVQVKMARAALGLSAQELAKQAGISAEAVELIEGGDADRAGGHSGVEPFLCLAGYRADRQRRCEGKGAGNAGFGDGRGSDDRQRWWSGLSLNRIRWAAAISGWLAVLSLAEAAEASYPFEGAWVRADRTCSATSTRERVYTTHDVTSSRGRCVIRKVATGSGNVFELFERCERPNERPSSVRETIQITGPASMTLTRQTARLKLSRSLRFSKCPAVQPVVPKPAH